MKCFAHGEQDAIATCVYCGKGLCEACIAPAGGGRLVCSERCATLLRRRQQFGAGRFLMGFAVLLVAASMFFGAHRWWALAVVTLLYALACLLVSAAMVSEQVGEWKPMGDDSFTPFYWLSKEARLRAGLALREAHAYRKALAEFLSLSASAGDRPITLSELEWADHESRGQMLERMCSACGDIPTWLASSPQAAAGELTEQVEVMRRISWTFFAHCHLTNRKSFKEQQDLVTELITAARKLDRGAFRVRMLARQLAKAEKPASKAPG
ncbi:MAG TPA: hypothetical protein VMV72_00260 [Verrucomicrobiae bacterium]|nr:hypothetical protein [Verrucomicrobiae bacterium]